MITPSTGALLVASLASLASAAPFVSNEVTNGSFSLKQVKNRAFSRHGPSALAKAYLKYGAPMPDDLAQAMDRYKLEKRDGSGSQTTTPANGDVEWLTPVQIGTPAQTLNLDFDTGSSDLWVFSSLTPKSSENGQTPYNIAGSSTAKKLSGYTWSISYGDGSSSSGSVYEDVVQIGPVSFASQAVEAASKVSSEFTSDSDNDGLLGLAFSSINSVKPKSQLTFFDNIKDSLTQPLFSVDLKSEAPGTYNFGAIDSSAYTGEIAYTTVSDSQGFWMFTASGYAVGTGAKGSSISGIADTGTTLLLLPTAVVKAYYAKVTGAKYDSQQGGYTLPCNGSPPNFTIYIGTTKITIPGKYFAFEPVTTGSTTCFGGLQTNSGIGFSIFGDIALKAAYVVFENSGSTPRLGWANKSL